ncbi:unnamed protein product [Hymenolepis diminuta]|uniref:Uncharacterized protein n=1 Tax=Hymenolepis diminuta TaxID=6216 RepID=A0A564YTL4_HYMDI|nr:unnamed protein product [Hymenolepis diminuta]
MPLEEMSSSYDKVPSNDKSVTEKNEEMEEEEMSKNKIGKLVASRLHFRPATNFPEIDKKFITRSETTWNAENANVKYIIVSSWDFIYPPNAKARHHCAKIIYDAIGQPDQISMRRTNSGYEICELQWELKPNDEIPENVKNLDLIGRIEISLPQYEDYGDEEVHWEDTYTANFKIIDRHYEMETCRALYTFIWNNGPSTSADPNFDLIETPPISPNAVLGIYHGNHWHIQFFSSSKNAHRKMDYVIRFILNGTVPEETKASMLIKCSVTRQLIRNPINFMRYLVVKFNGQVFYDGKDSQILYLYNIFQNFLKNKEILIPPDIVGECYNVTEMKRLNMREELAMKTRNKFERERSLFDLFKSLNIQFEEEFNEWLKTDPNQLPNIWAKYGQNWRTKLREYIDMC